MPNEPQHSNLSVPANLNPKEFIEYICYNIINDPYLAHTAYAQNMARDLSYGLISRGGSIRSFTQKDAVESLEQHLRTKLMISDVLSGKANLKQEDYL
jgi:hypothetical protein